MNCENDIAVEVVFALPGRQKLTALTVSGDTSPATAFHASGLAQEFPDFDFTACEFAVWGKAVGADYRLEHGDRVEVLRPLKIDPRDARRELAKEGHFMGAQGAGDKTD